MPDNRNILRSHDNIGEGGFPLATSRIASQEPLDLHTHEFTELTIILAGRGMHCLGGEEYEIQAGDVFVIQHNDEHGFADTKNLQLVNIMFDPAELLTPASMIRKLPGYHVLFSLEPRSRHQHKFQSRLKLGVKALTKVAGLVQSLEAEIAGRGPGYELMAAAIFLQTVGYLSRCYHAMPSGRSQEMVRLAEAISFIENNFNQPITLESLARKAHLSPRSMLRAFRSATGFSPIDYLIRLRVSRACELLRNTTLNITEVAFTVGFTDSNYFARQFRKITGLSPRELRKLETRNSEITR